MSERPPRSTGLLPWAASAAWGWRLELALAAGIVAGARVANELGRGGGLLLAGIIAIAWWRLPGLRRRLVRALRDSAHRRRFARAVRACWVGRLTTALPAIHSVIPTPAGFRVRVRVPVGTHTGHLAERAETMAAALRVREVRVERAADDASLADLVVVRRDPLAEAVVDWPWRHRPTTSLWESVPLGIDEEGHAVEVRLPEHNLLLGGEPGAGKSAALSLLVAAAALDPRVTLTLLDGKQVELAPWMGASDRFVGPDPADAIEVLNDIRTEMDVRYERLLKERRRKVDPEHGPGLHVVAVDELAYFLRGGTREQRTAIAEAFRDLVSRGRAAGIVVLAATQKPSHEVIPTWIRDLFSFRLALRCTTPEASDTILGQGWASQGYSAATIDPAIRGVGFLLHEGGVPRKLRTAYLDDEGVANIAARAAAVRLTGEPGSWWRER